MSLVATIERERERLTRLAQRRIPNPADAPDIVQRAAMKVINANHRRPIAQRAEIPYLVQAVRSEIVDHFRDRYRRNELPIDDFVHLGAEDPREGDDLELLLKLVPSRYVPLVMAIIQHEGDHIAAQRALGMRGNSYRTRLRRMRMAVEKAREREGL